MQPLLIIFSDKFLDACSTFHFASRFHRRILKEMLKKFIFSLLKTVYNINDENKFMIKFMDYLKTSEFWIKDSSLIENLLDALNVALNLA